ncbi:MAG: sugar phosphate isomerase/epimerase [Phycisphaeraceae bacterium]|nr:sugar phosphate isomerase/epimerase [Phycisphaeraceae bacterium]
MSVERSIGVCSWSLRPESPARLAEQVRSIPLDAVQLALVPLIEQPRQWCDAIAILRAEGVRVLSGMMATVGEDYRTLESIRRTGGFRPDETWKANLDRALRLADLCADHALGLITVHAGFIPEDRSDPLMAIMVERLRTIADVFARRHVMVALETGQERAEALVHFLDAVGAANLGVNFDPANMILYGMGDPVDALRLLAPRVRQVHLKDAQPTEKPGTWGREVPVGSGAVDWPAFARELRRLDPPVDLIIERESGGQRLDDVRAALTMARSMMSE